MTEHAYDPEEQSHDPERAEQDSERLPHVDDLLSGSPEREAHDRSEDDRYVVSDAAEDEEGLIEPPD